MLYTMTALVLLESLIKLARKQAWRLISLILIDNFNEICTANIKSSDHS